MYRFYCLDVFLAKIYKVLRYKLYSYDGFNRFGLNFKESNK